MLTVQQCRQLGLILCVFLISACGLQTRVDGLQVTQDRKEELQAQQLFAQGEYQQAATLFKRLAEKPSMQRDNFRLQVAEALLKMGEYNEAKGYLGLITAEELTAEQRNQLQLIYAQLFLSTGEVDRAIKRLQLISPPYLNSRQQRIYHEEFAFAYALTGQSLAGVRQRIALEPYLELERKQENNIAILEVLKLLPANTLDRELIGQSDNIYSGWLELAIINSRFLKGTPEINQAIAAWALRYPQHSGREVMTSGYFDVPTIITDDINNIAVFLPESGPYHAYAKAIREGIMAAYRQQEKYVLQPDIQFYDTQAVAIGDLYYQVVSQGAQLVIGPLNKKRIMELAESRHLTVPVLALNYVEGLVKENLYQFALSPIDEVRQAANQARFEGYKNAIILAPETPDGERLAGYFQDAWDALGGNILAVQGFDPRAKDFSFAVRQMLNVNESQDRFASVQKAMGSVEYNARRRQDVDVIFIVAASHVARLINPYFYHNRAESVAVYGLSRLYSGHPEPKKDIDLEGVNFCSIPWLFSQVYQGDLDMLALQGVWQPLPDRFLSLIAFGIDAYTLIPHLNNLISEAHRGATGDLLLNEHNRIERRLVCAKFKKGEVRLLNTHKEITEKYESAIKESMPTASSY